MAKGTDLKNYFNLSQMEILNYSKRSLKPSLSMKKEKSLSVSR